MDNSIVNFEWKKIGDIKKGRPTLGDEMDVSVYRMFYFSLRNILERNFGIDTTKRMLVEAGRMSGIEFCKNMLDISLPYYEFFDLLKDKMEHLGIGILDVEHSDFENMIFILTVSEDLNCSGVEATGEAICNFDEGLLMGILEIYTGKQFMVKEIDCWSTGYYTCRFNIVAI